MSHVELKFIDNGPGIKNDDLCVAAFERFTRIEEHRNADMAEEVDLVFLWSKPDGRNGWFGELLVS